MSGVLLMSLGPVQDFIASARRCQDLWFGSWLLSELARATAEAVEGLGTVVFPALEDPVDGEKPGIANKILVLLADGTDPADAAARAREAHQSRLREIATAAWEGLPERFFRRETALRQLDELMEFLWVAVPMDERDYKAARDEAETRLAAVKNTRPWGQPGWGPGAGIPKSSLDGERESVIDEEVYGWPAERRRSTFGIKRKERLCGVGLLKRLGVERAEVFGPRGRPPFHSTSHIAALPLLDRLSSTEEGRAATEVYVQELRRLGLGLERFRLGGSGPTLSGYDGILLFESRLPEHFEEVEGFSAEEAREAAKAASEALSDLLARVGARAPDPYYVFLMADGDRMGKAINDVCRIEDHQALGQALDRFAAGCRAIVQRHHGTLIFAGGDDVLALLPLHRALACARELAETFAATVQPAVDAALPEGGPKTSLSVGLAVYHMQEPMADARQLAKAAESEAKKLRNALAVKVEKRGGGEITLSGPWDAPDPLDVRLARWLEVLGAGELSTKAAHDLVVAAAHYRGTTADQSEEARTLAKQILSRKRERGGGASSTMTDALLDRLEENRPPAEQLLALSWELQVALMLHRARQDADAGASP